jgi:transcriptional regulator with XRE-family HTH domain
LPHVVERGGNTPGLTTILAMADAFGVEAAELVREVEEGRKRRKTAVEAP